MSAGRRFGWLGLTPEPERELPVAVGTLRARRTPGMSVEARIAAEAHRIERLIMYGTQRTWLRYLSEVTRLITDAADACSSAEAAPSAAGPTHYECVALTLGAAETVLDHQRMLIGLPGPGYDRVATDRNVLARVVADLREQAAGR